MKTKSKKSVSKRFKLTAKGHLKHDVGQWNHMRMKKKTKVHARKHSERVITSSTQERALRNFMSK